MTNAKKFLRVIGIGLAVLLALCAVGLSIWSATSTYPAGETALAALQPSQSVYVSQERWIEFTPQIPTDTGLIFYPGGLVAPESYAPVLRRLAEEGILVVITPMPLNFAIFNANAANAVIDAHPQISQWVLAGHSLGGVAAAIFAENNPGEITGLALWDSYPPDSVDLSDNDVAVISIYGTTNNIPNTKDFFEKTHLLPNEANFKAIEGASHAQFGDYGPQQGDVTPSISAEEQHTLVFEAMLEFIRR